MTDRGFRLTVPTPEQCERAYYALLAEYNRIVDYIDSTQLAVDFQAVMREPGHAIGDTRFTAGHLAEYLRREIHVQAAPDGWQPIPDDGHDAPPELLRRSIWFATTRGDVSAGYWDENLKCPAIFDAEQAVQGVYRWWRPMEAKLPPISLGAQPPLPDYAACKQPTRDTSTTVGVVTHIRDRWVDVHLETDNDDETIGCRNECGEDLAIGDTVVTQFVPPHTVYVVTKLKGGASA